MSILYRQTAEPASATPAFTGAARTDVAIIGAGFTGLSTALHLAERGVRVALLDAHEPGFGASGRNGGQVNAGLKPNPDEVERDHGMDLGRRMNAFAGAAPDLVFELIARHGIHCEARRNGTLRVAPRPGHVKQLEVTAAQLAERGVPVQMLSRATLATAVGHDRYPAGLLDPRGGDVNPLSLARGLARAALAAGAQIHGSSRVVRLEQRNAGSWRLHLATAHLDATHVVIATNGYTDGVWPQLARTLVPVFGAIAATETLPPELAPLVMPSGAVLFEIGAVTVYYRVDAGGRLLMGGRGPMHEVTEPAEVNHLLDYARLLWPGLHRSAFTGAWGGRLAMTPDHYPHVHEPAAGIHICLGFNGRGVALGTAMGVLLARRIAQPEAAFDMPITALKPIALHGLWPLAVQGMILSARLRDFLGL